jgi:hypothetical protein
LLRKEKPMTMKLIKKTAEYSIYQRGDERYAVKDAHKNPSTATRRCVSCWPRA